MSIVKKKPSNEFIRDFIAAAPDGKQPVPVTDLSARPKKAVINLTIDPAVLADLDRYSSENGLSRSAAMTVAVRALLKA